jgi:hypothetical protein
MTNLLLNHMRRLAPKMPAIRKLTFFFALAFFPLLSRAANLTLQGNFTADDNVQFFSVSVAAPAAVDIRSYGYAGGTTSTGTLVPRGGFDTILTLFNSSGVFLNENDDGAGAAEDPSTGLAGDARITGNLAAGSYILALTQYDNFSSGDLAGGFVETGHPNFTADPTFADGGPCPGNMFRDISGTDGRCRTGNWMLEFVNVASVTPVAATPEPSALLLAAVGLALLLASRLRGRKKETLLAVILLAVLASSPVQGQSDPDFTNVNDILHGNRTLLQITDLQILTWQKDSTQLNFDQLMTSNSSITKTSSFPANIPPDIYNPYGTKSFSGSMFNQPQPVTVSEVSAQQTQNNLYLVTTNIQDAGPWFSAVGNFDTFDFNAGAMADFNKDGYDDFAFSFDDGNIQIATAADVNNPSAGSSGPFKLGPMTQLDKLTDMTAGDFKGDGQHEIAGLNFTAVDGIQLVIYTVDPNSLAITPANSLVLTTPLGYAIAYASIARGRFNTTTRDQLAVTFSSAAGPSIVQIIDFMPNTLTPVGGPQLTISTLPIPFGYLQVATGKFGLPDNPYDQIVFHMSSGTNGGRFFEVVSASQTDLTLTAHSGVTYNQFPCAAGIQVGNFDNQQTNQHNPNSQIALLYCSSDTTSTMNIYSVDSQTFDVQSDTPTAYPLSVSAQNTSFVATDLQGRSMLLGEPTIVTIDNTTPTVINSAPPMHIDYITPFNGNKPQVLNLSFIPDGFNSSFKLTQASKTGGSTTHKLSWSAGVDLSVGYSYTVGDPDNATGAKFSAAFDAADKVTGSSDNSTVSYGTSTFDVGASTTTGDAVYTDQSRLNIWVYPVIGQTACPASLKNPNCTPDEQKPLTIQFSGPDQITSGAVSASDLSTNSYQPPWEFGNIFSYPATKDQLALIFPDLANTQLSAELAFDTDNLNQTIQASWSSSTEQGSTTSLTNDASFDVSMSGVDAFGIKGFGTSRVNESLKLSASLGYANLQTNTAEVDASDGVLIQATAKFPDPGNYKYTVMPFILGNPPPSQQVGDSQQPPQANISTIGPLRTAFTADPLNKGAFWKQAYSSAPDVALNHPSRWVLTTGQLSTPIPANCADTGNGNNPMDCADIAPLYDDTHQPLNPWNSNFLSMHGFFITPADNPGAGPQLQVATAGDQLDLAVRVYNYSLATMPDGSTVHVRFYAMPWDNNNDAPADDSILIGETVADPIPAFSDTATDLNWRLVHAPVPFDTTSYAGKFFVFWVVVWMEDSNGHLVTEIPGHGLTSIPSTLKKPSDVPLEMATAINGQSTVSYSNNVGLYHYAFPVLPPETGLGAPPPDNPEDITLKSVSAAKQRLQPGGLDEITAVLRAGSEGTRRLKVYFYDGDPDKGGKLIGIEPAWFQPRSITKVRLPYHPASDGVYRIWAVINKGKPYQTERHTAAIVVGKAKADLNNSGGDDPPKDKDSDEQN